MPPEDPRDTDPAVAGTLASDSPEASASASASGRGKAPRAVHSGDVLGRYELGDELGEGGMATVYRARDRELRREVAIKVLFPHLARRPEIVRRFHREARAAAGLEHPNILRIYDVGGDEGEPPYIVMELIRGRTLLEEIEQRGALLAELVACVGALLADALAAAHAALIVHRDVKPSNVLVAAGGRLLLADFGVARLESESSLLTRTGALLGTPAYMSPEQASGDVATARSDLYSLGATLYQLATGALPYGGSPAKVMSQIATGALVAPVKRRAAVGPDLSRLIERLTATDPDARPGTAAAVARELRQLAADGGLAGDPADELAAYFADPAAFVAARTPAIVAAIVAAGERAIAEQRLPRAIALADRAAALAPADPVVTALVRRVTEGGRSSRRRRIALVGVASALLAGGTTVVALSRADAPATVDAPDVATPDATIDIAPVVANDAAVLATLAPDATGDAPVDAPPASSPRDAARAIADPASPRAIRRDAARALPLDAAVPAAVVPIDAPPPPVDALATGTLAVRNDTWCEVTIDGAARGKIMQRQTYTVPAGRHVVTCAQPGIAGHHWREEVDVPAGGSATARGEMLALVEVTIAAGDVTIDGTAHARGAVARLKPGRYKISVVGGPAGYVDVPRAGRCRLRVDGGRIVCDP